MGVITDIIGSIVVRGMIIAIVIGLTVMLRDELFRRTSAATTYQTLSVVGSVIEKDLTSAGYNVAVRPVFLKADSDDCKFMGDVDNNGIVDTVEFVLAREAGDTDPNSKIRILTRTLGGTPLQITRAPVTMKFEYYDSLSVSTTNLLKVNSISVLLSQWDSYQSDNPKAIVRKEIRVFPSNL